MNFVFMKKTNGIVKIAEKIILNQKLFSPSTSSLCCNKFQFQFQFYLEEEKS
jgi:hypothetical protein